MKKITQTESIPEVFESLEAISKDAEIFVDKSFAISSRIFRFMNLKGWMQKDLADKMGKTEAEISKLVSGAHNYTLRTISKIESVLGIDLIVIPDIKIGKFDIKSNLHGFYYIEKGMIKEKWQGEGKVVQFKVVSKEPDFSKAS